MNLTPEQLQANIASRTNEAATLLAPGRLLDITEARRLVGLLREACSSATSLEHRLAGNPAPKIGD